MRWIALLLIAFIGTSGALRAEDSVVAGLNQHLVSLTTDFSGSSLFVYGSVYLEEGDNRDFDVIVAVTGPSEPVLVRKKERTGGIWINGPGVQIDSAPSFYAVASTRPVDDIISRTADMAHRIALRHFITLIDAPDWLEDREAYRKAVERIRTDQGLYAVFPDAVRVIGKPGNPQHKAFETRIELPANLVEGDYEARVFLIRDKSVRDSFTDNIEVRRAGLGRFIYTQAQENAALYGFASILVALAAGWLASAFFRTFFPN